MRAIILAAGLGTRLLPLTQDIPKTLLTIAGETFLERQLRILRKCGMKDITIVTGYHSEKIAELYGEELSIRYNPEYQRTGNIFSLWTVRDLLTDDVLIISADGIFTEEPLRAMLVDHKPYCLLIVKKPCDGEAMKIKVKGDIIADISKAIPIEEAYGEFAGISIVRKEGLEVFQRSLLKWVQKTPESSVATIFQDLAKNGCRINFISISHGWIEVDTKEDYEEAKKLFESKPPLD